MKREKNRRPGTKLTHQNKSSFLCCLLPSSSSSELPVGIDIKKCVCVCVCVCVCLIRLFATPWTVATKVLCPWGFPDKNTGADSRPVSRGSS